MKQNKLPVILLTGFLGSGKTLLLNALLASPGYANTAVVVNEFGEIGLDHLLVQASTDNIVLLEAGCLCCTIADSLHETLADLHFRRQRGEIPPFERVVIETTGLADPAPILNTLLGNKLITAHFRLTAVVVTADAMHAIADIGRHRELLKQIAVADRLVITKRDLATEQQVSDLKQRLQQLNPGAEIFASRRGANALAAFAPDHASPARGIPAPPAHHPAHDVDRHDAHIRAHCVVLDAAVSWSGYAAWTRLMVDTLGERLLRCKGVLEISDRGEVVFVQGVQRVFHTPERLPGWPDADHRPRLVCITRDVTENEIRRILPALSLPEGSDPNITLADLAAPAIP
ncbi:MAG: GTP-binding protein [Betaproteobacteria bacterium]|nr:GTP-binding protein [Betaproteobacteria bacterium]